jgi:hypothetical protein
VSIKRHIREIITLAELANVFTLLDLLKADTPLTGRKISRMLHQLEFKLHVEKQYKEGIDKMARLYQVHFDPRLRGSPGDARADLEAGLARPTVTVDRSKMQRPNESNRLRR